MNRLLMRATTMRLAALGGIAALALAGCETGPDIRADYDKAVDFGKYRTYNFVASTGTAARADPKSLAHTAPAERRLARDGEPRLYEGRQRGPADQLQGQDRGEDRHRVDAGADVRRGLGLSRLYGAPYGAYGYGGTEVSTRRYNVGTLVMDIVDREKKQVVFQGGVEDVVTKKMLEDREALLSGAVTNIFSKYPFRAGQSAPVALPET